MSKPLHRILYVEDEPDIHVIPKPFDPMQVCSQIHAIWEARRNP